MENKIILKVGFIDENKVKFVCISSDKNKYQLHRSVLKYQIKKINNILNDLCTKEIIKSNKRPRNNKIQKYLDELILAKRINREAIDKISNLFI